MWDQIVQFTADFTRADWIRVAGVAVSAVGLFFIWRQLRTNGHQLVLNTRNHRHSLFIKLTDAVKDDAYKTAMLHLSDHITLPTFHQRYVGNKRRFESFILMKRKYQYLYVSSDLEMNLPRRQRGITASWLNELVKYQEFRDVHERHQVYYPRFAKAVNKAIESYGQEPPVWMCEEYLEPEPKNPEAPTIPMTPEIGQKSA